MYDLTFIMRETRRNESNVNERNKHTRDRAGLRRSFSRLEDFSQNFGIYSCVKRRAFLGKLTACLFAASNRNDYAIIMILLVGNVRATEQLCSLKKYRVMFVLLRNVINARLENFISGLPVVHTRVLRESNIL